MIRRRHLLYALAARAAALPASAAASGETAAAAALSVNVSLERCGGAATGVVCKLDATFTPVDGGQYYTAAVTRPNGSVVDYGNVPSGAASLWVPYVGNGTYTVSVSAWGEPVQNPKPLATDTASPGDAGDAAGSTASPG